MTTKLLLISFTMILKLELILASFAWSSSRCTCTSRMNIVDKHNTATTCLWSTSPRSGYEVSILYEGHRDSIFVEPTETILAALERSTPALKNRTLNNLPHECRRGNCLTCSGRIQNGAKSVRQDETTFLSEEARKEGFLLLCSSFVMGDGLSIELGRKEDAWKINYQDRFQSEDTQRIGAEASAKMMREIAERNPKRWLARTERILEEEADNEDL